MTKWFEMIFPAVVIVLGIGTVWRRDVPVEIENGPEPFRIRGVFADALGTVLIIGGAYFLLMEV